MNKVDYTRELLKLLPEQDQIGLDTAIKEWWQDIRPTGGLRLSQTGFDIFTQLKIDKYVFDVPPSLPARPGQLITLTHKLTCPYHVSYGKAPRLTLFGSKEATMFALYGDLEKWLKMLSRQ
jgi:hypothetical protein